MQKSFDAYADPGHGWVKVRKSLLSELGIETKITECSYMRGEFAYLEEECDATTLVEALKARGIVPKWREHHTNKDSKIKSYEPYKAPGKLPKCNECNMDFQTEEDLAIHNGLNHIRKPGSPINDQLAAEAGMSPESFSAPRVLFASTKSGVIYRGTNKPGPGPQLHEDIKRNVKNWLGYHSIEETARQFGLTEQDVKNIQLEFNQRERLNCNCCGAGQDANAISKETLALGLCNKCIDLGCVYSGKLGSWIHKGEQIVLDSELGERCQGHKGERKVTRNDLLEDLAKEGRVPDAEDCPRKDEHNSSESCYTCGYIMDEKEEIDSTTNEQAYNLSGINYEKDEPPKLTCDSCRVELTGKNGPAPNHPGNMCEKCAKEWDMNLANAMLEKMTKGPGIVKEATENSRPWP